MYPMIALLRSSRAGLSIPEIVRRLSIEPAAVRAIIDILLIHGVIYAPTNKRKTRRYRSRRLLRGAWKEASDLRL